MGSATNVSTSKVVERLRLSRMSCLRAGFHRLSPTPAPARWTTPSNGPAATSPSTSIVPRAGSQATSVTVSVFGLAPAVGVALAGVALAGTVRTSRVTRCPSPTRASTRAVPMSPDEPVRRTRMSPFYPAGVLERPGTPPSARATASLTNRANASGWVRWAPWPAPSISTSSEPGTCSRSHVTASR